MSSDFADKWDTQVEITINEFFNPPNSTPHPGIVSIVRKMEEIMGKEKAHKLLIDIMTQQVTNSVERMKKNVSINSFQDFLNLTPKEHPIYSHALDVEQIELTNKVSKFRVHSCIWVEAWKRLGATDIGFIWNCSSDFVQAETLHPSLKLERTQTLMEGHDYCNFKYYWEEDNG